MKASTRKRALKKATKKRAARAAAFRVSLLGLPVEIREMIFVELCKDQRPAVVLRYDKGIYQTEPKGPPPGAYACKKLWTEYRDTAYKFGLKHLVFRSADAARVPLEKFTDEELALRIELPVDLQDRSTFLSFGPHFTGVKRHRNELYRLRHVRRLAIDIILTNPDTDEPHSEFELQAGRYMCLTRTYIDMVLFDIPSLLTFCLSV